MKKGYIISGITVVVSAVAIVLYARNKAKEGFDEIREATTPEEELSEGENSSKEIKTNQ